MIGAVNLFLPHVAVLGPIGLVLITLLGAACGYGLAITRRGRLTGILLFGFGAIIFDVICFVAGELSSSQMGFLMLAWIAIITGGLFLAIWIQKQRDKTDMY